MKIWGRVVGSRAHDAQRALRMQRAWGMWLLTLAAMAGLGATRVHAAPAPPNNVSIGVNTASLAENSGNSFTYTFTRVGTTTSSLAVNFRLTGTAATPSDYTLSGATLVSGNLYTITIPSSQTQAQLTVSPVGDTVIESNETVIATIQTSANYNVGSPSAATASITNDDFADVSVSVSPTTVTEDGSDVLVYTFTRTGDLVGGITVNYAVTGTAGFYDDYYPSDATSFGANSGTIALPPNVSSATVSVIPISDESIENDETVTLTITSGSGYHIAGSPDNTATGSIINDDHNTVSVAVSPSPVNEDGTPDMIFTFTRTGDTTNALTVNYHIGGTADYGTDYNVGPSLSTIIIGAGDTTAYKDVDPLADGVSEPDETVVFVIDSDTDTSNKGYQIAASPGDQTTGTITNDDGQPQGGLPGEGPGPGGSYYFEVNTTADHDDGACTSNDCTLREAIAHSSAGDTVTFDSEVFNEETDDEEGPFVIGLFDSTNGGVLAVSHNLTIQGPEDVSVTISGNQTHRIMTVSSDATVLISNLTFYHGSSTGGGAGGGGILNNGNLALRYCVFDSNGTTAFGGAIKSNAGSSLGLNGCTVKSGEAAVGAGVFNSGASITIANSTFSGNSASSSAGAVYLNGLTSAQTATIYNSTFSNNTGTGFGGGALYIYGNGATVTATLTNCTVVGSAGNSDGGISVDGSSEATTLNLLNTILVNSANDSLQAAFATINDLGHNLSSFDASDYLTNGSSLNSTDAKLALAGLANNGGFTQTIALQGGSPAIDAGDDSVTGTPLFLNTDQRGGGYDRKEHTHVDIGAFEYVHSPETASLVVDTTADLSDNLDGKTSLREAIAYANSGDAGDGPTITFDSEVFGALGGPYTITLGSALPAIAHDVTIAGPGADVLTISGNDTYRIFDITGGPVHISGLTLTDGHTGADDGNGAGIRTSVALTVTECAFASNDSSSGGGAIAVNGSGGSASLTVERCLFNTNSAGAGGAIHIDAGEESSPVSIVNSTFFGNSATFAGGGAITADGDLGTINLGLTNCTFASNTTNSVANCIHAVGDGGSITVKLLNNIFSGSSGTNLDFSNDGGTVSVCDLGHNISSDDASSILTQSTDMNSTNPGLDTSGMGGLDDFGGPTFTVSLLHSSPAIDAGSDSVLDPCRLNLQTDQRGRGYARKRGAHVDIGAFEAPVEERSLIVNTDQDATDKFDGATSLREAVAYSNSGDAGHCPTITFDTDDSHDHYIYLGNYPGAYAILSISNGEFTISHDVTIRPAIAHSMLISNGSSRTFYVNECKSLSLDGLDIQLASFAPDGGGQIYVDGGSLSVNHCALGLSSSGFSGGSILNNGGTVFVSGSRIYNALTNAGGGAIANYNGQLYVANSTFDHNQGSFGGGGAILNSNGCVSVANSTFASNSANISLGGAIFNTGGELYLTNCTITNNTANKAGGIYNLGGYVNATNTVVAINNNSSGAAYDNLNFTLGGSHNYVGGSPMLGSLQDNGGPTQTMLPQPGSPLIDAGDDCVLKFLETDQRETGYARKYGSHVDIGAVEDRTNRAPIAHDASVYAYKNVAQTICLPVTDDAGDTLSYYLVSRPMNGARIYNGNSTASPLIGSSTPLPFKLASNKVTYLGPVNYTGSDSFTFKANDGALFSNTATISLTVVNPTPPSITITTPASNNQDYKDTALSEIRGTVTDNAPDDAGISRVTVYLYRPHTGGGYEYWDGTNFTYFTSFNLAVAGGAGRTTCVWGDTASGGNWKTNAGQLPAGLLPSGNYFMRADAVDVRGALTSAFRNIIVRTGPPTVTISSPTANQQVTNAALPSINGTVTDNSPTTAGIASVALNLYRTKIGGGYEYWNGTAWQSSSYALTASLAAPNWSVTNAPVGLQNSGTYYVKAWATDNNGAKGDSVTVTFKVTNGPPTMTITTPTNNQNIGHGPIPTITGTVTDNSPNTVGIQKIVLNLYRAKLGGGFEYWTNGGSWVTYVTSTAANAGDGALTCLVTGSAWACTATMPTGANLTAGTYNLRANAVDNTSVAGPNVYRSFTSTGYSVIDDAPGSGGSGLSSASASAGAGTVTLTFTTSLNSDSASDLSHYSAAVNGHSVTLQGVSGSGSSLVLTLAEGSLKAGDQVTVSWSGLKNSRGTTLSGTAGPLTAK